MQKSILVKNEKQLKKITKDILKYIQYPTIILLYGELGSGKTTFVKYLAKPLKIEQNITSPTFLINKIYKIKNKPYHLIHYDLYRLKKYQDLIEIGFEENLIGKNLIIIEWPGKIKNLVKKINKFINSKNIIKIYFYHIGQINQRKIIIKYEK